jgi:hypothetical protein
MIALARPSLRRPVLLPAWTALAVTHEGLDN